MPEPEDKPNLVLARLLEELQWTPERLAREVGAALGEQGRINQTTPYYWRDKGGVPRDPYPRVVCEILSQAIGAPITVEELWGARALRGRRAAAREAVLVDAPWTQQGAVHALSVAIEGYVTLRKTADVYRGSALLGAGQSWAKELAEPPVGEGPAVVDAVDLDALDASVAAKGPLEAAFGGGMVRDALREDLRLAVAMLRDGCYGAEAGRRLFGVAGRGAAHAGRACFDNGEGAAAQRYLVAALRSAHVAGDRLLGAEVLLALAAQSVRSGQPADALALLGEARAGADAELTDRIRARAWAWECCAAARSGDAEGAGRAAELALAGEPEPGVRGVVGEGLAILPERGFGEAARDQLRLAIEGLPVSERRTRALVELRLAVSLLRAGQVAGACDHAERAGAMSSGIRSARLSGLNADFRRALRRAAAEHPAASEYLTGPLGGPTPAVPVVLSVLGPTGALPRG